MNWYIKNIFAQEGNPNKLENYLNSLNIPTDIIQYILSLDANTAQILTNEIRKNPYLNIPQLQEIQKNQKTYSKDPYLPSEIKFANNFQLELPHFSKWILVNLRKLRNGVIPISGEMRENDRKKWPMYFEFKSKITYIADWMTRTHANISSYSAE